MTQFDELPPDTLGEILSFLPGRDIISRSRMINRSFYQLSFDNHLWKTVCEKEWRQTRKQEEITEQNYSNIPESDIENQNSEPDWKEIYKQRQIAYNSWKRNLDVRFWLPSDYLLLIWWLFIDPKSQPDQLPVDEADVVRNKAIRAGIYLITLSVFLPLILIAMVDQVYLLVVYFCIMAFIPVIFERLEMGTTSGIVILVLQTILLLVVSIMNAFNDVVLVILMMFSLSITLALARSMKAIIQENVEELQLVGFDGYPVIILTSSIVIMGALFGIAGWRAIFVIIFIILIALGVRGTSSSVHFMLGNQGVAMILSAFVGLILYFITIWSVGRRSSRTLSAIILCLLITLNLSMIIRFIMIVVYEYPIIYITN